MISCRSWRRVAGAAALMLRVWPAPAQAQIAPPVEPVAPVPGFWDRQNLLGVLGGMRPVLESRGLSLGLTETSEVLGNLTGGLRRGFAYDGLTTMSLSLDTAKAFGWAGGTFYLSGLQIHGRDLSADNLDNLQTASGIEAARSTRLWELWFRQSLGRGGNDLEIGQQSLDQEFIVSGYAGLYLNTVMGWPMLPSADLYAGGPAYPLSSLGVRLRLQPDAAATVLLGVFDDNPPGGPFFADAQLRGGEASGTRFNLGTGALMIGEIQYSLPRPPFVASSAELPGTYKLGLWVDTAPFPDQRFDTAGRSLAAPGGTGVARLHHGNFSAYVVADQQVWKAAQGPRSLGAFLRIMGAPDDRNLIDWSANAGINLKAPLPGRDNDTVGISYDWAHVSGRASALDEDTRMFAMAAVPVRRCEHVVELTYRYQAAPWWVMQPDLQYVVNPRGGILDPRDPARRLGDELIVGVRTTIAF